MGLRCACFLDNIAEDVAKNHISSQKICRKTFTQVTYNSCNSDQKHTGCVCLCLTTCLSDILQRFDGSTFVIKYRLLQSDAKTHKTNPCFTVETAHVETEGFKRHRAATQEAPVRWK